MPGALVQPPQPRSQQEALGQRGGTTPLPTPQTPRQPLEGYLEALRRTVPPPPPSTDNDIKNHFYSTLRRSLRRLNKISGEKNSTSQMREIKPSVLSTIMNYIYDQQHGLERDLFRSLQGTPSLNQTSPRSSSSSPTSNPSRPTSGGPHSRTHETASQRYSHSSPASSTPHPTQRGVRAQQAGKAQHQAEETALEEGLPRNGLAAARKPIGQRRTRRSQVLQRNHPQRIAHQPRRVRR